MDFNNMSNPSRTDFYLLCIVATAWAITGCGRHAGADVMARVNSYDIMRAEVDKALHAQMANSPHQLTADQEDMARLQIIDQAISRQLLLQRADKIGATVSGDDVNAKLFREKLGESTLGSKTKSDQLFGYSRAAVTLLFLGLGKLLTSNYTTPDQKFRDALFHAKLAIGKSLIILKDRQPVNVDRRTVLFCLVALALKWQENLKFFRVGPPEQRPIWQSAPGTGNS